jgi:hypothetical protein
MDGFTVVPEGERAGELDSVWSLLVDSVDVFLRDDPDAHRTILLRRALPSHLPDDQPYSEGGEKQH